MRRERDAWAPPPSLKPGQVVVFYDGRCGMCSGIRELLARLDLRARIAWIPLQTPGALECVGLRLEEAEQTVWAVGADGRLVRGIDVIAAVADALLPTAGGVSRAFRFALLRRILEPMFHFVSENRRRVAVCPLPATDPFPPLSERDQQWLRSCGARRARGD